MTVEILNRAQEALRNMQFSLTNYKKSNDENKILYLRNLITTGRSVTFILQNLKSHVDKNAFEEWYLPWRTKMSNDEILRTFKDLRNEIEKQGKLNTSLTAHIEHFNSNDIQPLLKNPPPFSKSFFIGDQIGGSGWEIDYGNGITEKLYIVLPQDIKMVIDFEIIDLTSLDNDMSTIDMLEYYYDYLHAIYIDARKTFLKP